jgi:hypothetical protein
LADEFLDGLLDQDLSGIVLWATGTIVERWDDV